MGVVIKLAWRSIWRNKRRTIISVVSITFGLAAALFFITLADGAYYQIIQDGVKMLAGHVTIEHPEYRDAPAVDLYVENSTEIRQKIETLQDVDRTKLLVLGQGVARSGAGSVGVGFMGIEPSLELMTNPIANKIVDGEFLDDSDERVVVIGSILAKRLELEIGRKMVISTNDTDGNLVEELCRIKGIYSTGAEEIDGVYVLTPIDFARQLMGLPDDSATQIGVIIKNLESMDKVQRDVSMLVNNENVAVLTWKQVMPDLNAYIKMDRGSNLIFQGIILVLVMFTIFNTILMSVLERKREFAVLLAIGTSPKQLQMQILMETIFLGILGVFFGLIAGSAIALYYQTYGLDFSSMLEDDVTVSGLVMEAKIYARLTSKVLIWCAIIVFFSTVFLSWFPMKRAANTPFTDVLR